MWGYLAVRDDGRRSFLLGESPETQPVLTSSGRLCPGSLLVSCLPVIEVVLNLLCNSNLILIGFLLLYCDIEKIHIHKFYRFGIEYWYENYLLICFSLEKLFQRQLR